LSSEILISSDPWENRVAILEDGGLAELYIEREEKVIGSIYKGKVQNVLPGMGAAFVDIGLGRNAFLYVDDINKQPLNIGDVEITQGHSGFTISEKVKRGDDVLVQIVKEPRGLKGARISTNISLPGRYLILMPTGKYSGVSRKIESAEERNRLKTVMKRIRPEGMATVVRTAAAGASEAELIADLGVLIRMWHGILETYKRAASPSLLHKDMNLVYKAARDFITADVDRVLIDDEEEYRKIRDFLQLLGPQYIGRIEYYNSGRSLFDDYKISDELQKLMKPKINLPSGASIVIESTEALTVIDVNSGKFTGGRNLEDTILKTNIEAAEEIARQVRLRDIGGIIVVDFIDMASEASRDKVVKTMEESLRRDRTRATIQSFSNLGLLEFTRKRVGKDLGSQLRGACPTCAGMGSVMSAQSVAIETFRQIRKQAGNGQTDDVVVHVAPTVAVQMDFWYEAECEELARSIGHPIHVRVDPMIHPEKARIESLTGIKEKAHLVRVGDEHEVELLPGRLPNATSAAAVVDGRIAEVENAANIAGSFVRIRIIDVDDADDYVLAELVTAGAKPKRKRRGARRAPLSTAEQTRQLRELAEDAARQSASRPPIGISPVTEEEEAADKALRAERKGEAQPDAIIIAQGTVQHTGEEGGRRKRRRRRRGRGRDEAPVVADEVGATAPVETVSFAEAAVSSDGAGQHRRRRRRRRGRRGRGGAVPGVAMPDRHIFEVSSDGAAHATGSTAPPEPSRAIATVVETRPPAVEPPPPSLSAPAEETKRTKPARRRRTVKTVAGELEGSASALALPPPERKPRRTRKAQGAAEKGSTAPVATEAPARKRRPAAKKKSS
jgi:ribonuclease G